MKVVGITTFHTLYSIYIYIYIQVFSNIFVQNQRITQINKLFQAKTTQIVVYFCENEWKQNALRCSRRYFVRFALFLRKSLCTATETGNLRVISSRKCPRMKAARIKNNFCPEIYPRHPVYAIRLAVWRTFLIFYKKFVIIYIQSKGKIKHFRQLWIHKRYKGD